MHRLVISSPRAEMPSAARDNDKRFRVRLDPLVESGTVEHACTRPGRGAVIIFEIDSHETLHKLVIRWAECVPATSEVHALLPRSHQESIARAGISPMAL